MILTERWKKISLFLFIILPVLIFISCTQALALFGPAITDVTTKAFSVAWTTSVNYSTCGIRLYTNSSYTTQLSIDQSQIIPETQGKTYRIAKVTVVGLNYDTTYYFKPLLDGNPVAFNGVVTTAKLRGLLSNDPNATDIVSNDVVHKAAYKSDGTSPAQGVLVVAQILDPAKSEADPNSVRSYYPLSAWVGDGMIGSEASTTYDPNNPSYKQYAALNMNNLFGKDRFPLSLHGDNAATTTVNESEIVKFTIVHGTLPVLGQVTGQDNFTSYGRIDSVDKVNGEKMVTAKVSASVTFKKGLTPFAFPFKIPDVYTAGQLLKDIETAQGKQSIATIYVFQSGTWLITKRFSATFIQNANTLIQAGKGIFVSLTEDMTKGVIFYGKPDSMSVNLNPGAVNLVALPQLPAYYKTGNFLTDIENNSGAGAGSVNTVWYFSVGAWKPTKKFGTFISGSTAMVNDTFYFVTQNSGAQQVTNWDPFSSEE